MCCTGDRPEIFSRVPQPWGRSNGRGSHGVPSGVTPINKEVPVCAYLEDDDAGLTRQQTARARGRID